MTIVNPLASANLVVQTTQTTARPEERQVDLRMEQIIRATVAEGGLDKATLEFNGQRVPIQTEQELLTGQQLQLQVVSLFPRLSFKVLTQPLESRLATLLPLLGKSFDWHALIQTLETSPEKVARPFVPVLQQLSGLLRPAAELPAEQMTELIVSLGQLRRSGPLFAVKNGPQLATAFDRVIQTLNQRVEVLSLPQQLRVMAAQVRLEPEMMQNFMQVEQVKIREILTRLESPRPDAEMPRPTLEPRQARVLASELKDLLGSRPSDTPKPVVHLGQELGRLLAQTADSEFELSPALLDQLKVLTQHLQEAVASRAEWPRPLLQVVQQVLSVLQPLQNDPDILKTGGTLGLLPNLFGLNLEAELLRGRTREALSSLKLALLSMDENLGPKGEEALHRLELFQFCRARLAEHGQLFIPLPLPYLEEGYLLADHDDQKDHGEAERAFSNVSLHLRLSALGNLRIDLLSEASGTHLRIACEDQQRASFLQAACDDLKDRLKQFPLRAVSFTTGAESPTRTLIEKIVPRASSMLDARV